MPHICPHCDRIFSQKGHLEKHLNKKKTCEKCNVSFTSQYAYINNEYIHVKDYEKNKGDKIKCARGHELVLCNGKKIRKYFRHKNSEDLGGNPMTEWHSRMQSYFPVTEFRLKKLNDEQIKERRADALIENQNCIIEFEHSGKTIEEVICKTKDCLLHDKKIIWFIDGNTKDVKIEHLSSDNYLISFDDDWKYKSFVHNYEFVLLDIDDQIFKIPVKQVCNKMILVKEWKPIEYVMEILNTDPNNIWDEWEDDNEIKAKLIVQQKGAGNGKTFGIWKSIAHNHDKELFIIVTKQHSAKTVIMKELNDQAQRNEYHIVNNMLDRKDNMNARKYIIKYKHNHSERNCTVIISTIDALMFNLSSNGIHNQSNYFEGLLDTIISHGVEYDNDNDSGKVNKMTGSFRYANESLCLNKKTELWIDEAQDLHEKYFKAIIELMIATKIDTIIVGDKLQSLEYKTNFMTCIEENNSTINIIRETPVNNNRRIEIEGMSKNINKLIKFKNYDLPEINVNTEKLISNEESTIEIIEAPHILAGVISDENDKNINSHIDKIIKTVDKEVRLHNYSPEDFLFVFPIMKSNLIACELETKLNEYWINSKDETETYQQYAVLHKHEEGQVIDTSLSEKASRIVTIRTSKGDGRKVVFVLGCNEQSLKIVSRSDNIDLIYESYLHVALTRAKNKIYFALEKNNDEIHRRFGAQGLVEYCPDIKISISHDKILNFIDKEQTIQLLKNNGIEEPPSDKKEAINSKQQIDWEYHCIRRSVYLMYAIFNIFKHNMNKENFKKSQIKTVLDELSKLTICILTPRPFYKYINSYKLRPKLDNLDYIPICNLSHKREIYKTYAKKIEHHMNNNKNKYITNPLSLANLKPVEAVIQWYTIELYRRKNYCDTTPGSIYNIIHHFEQEDDTKITDFFRETENIKDTTTTAMTDILNNSNYVDWNIEHMIKMFGETKKFSIRVSSFPIIGYSKSNTYHLVFKTDFNQLNFWDTMIQILIERFIIFNTSDKGKDSEKFAGKPITTYLFILKENKYEKFDWDWHSSEENTLNLRELFKSAIVKYYSTFNTMLFNYCKFIKNNKEKWKEHYESPFHSISDRYKNVMYVRDFFIGLHERSKDDRAGVKKITDNHDLFCEKLTERIEDMCNSFFGLNKQVDDNEEW